jgi:hypothetical protein
MCGVVMLVPSNSKMEDYPFLAASWECTENQVVKMTLEYLYFIYRYMTTFNKCRVEQNFPKI